MFVNEYRNLLADRLLQSLDYNISREVCKLIYVTSESKYYASSGIISAGIMCDSNRDWRRMHIKYACI